MLFEQAIKHFRMNCNFEHEAKQCLYGRISTTIWYFHQTEHNGVIINLYNESNLKHIEVWHILNKHVFLLAHNEYNIFELFCLKNRIHKSIIYGFYWNNI